MVRLKAARIAKCRSVYGPRNRREMAVKVRLASLPFYQMPSPLALFTLGIGANVLASLPVSYIVAALEDGRESGSSHILKRELRLGAIIACITRYTFTEDGISRTSCMLVLVNLQRLAGRSGELLGAGISVKYST